MKNLVSLLFQILPIAGVTYLLGRGEGFCRKAVLRYIGPALVASGAASYLGIKCFDLPIYRKGAVLENGRAESMALAIMSFGAFLYLLHFLVPLLFAPIWKRVATAVLSVMPESIPRLAKKCICPRCKSALGNREVTVCPACGISIAVLQVRKDG